MESEILSQGKTGPDVLEEGVRIGCGSCQGFVEEQTAIHDISLPEAGCPRDFSGLTIVYGSNGFDRDDNDYAVTIALDGYTGSTTGRRFHLRLNHPRKRKPAHASRT